MEQNAEVAQTINQRRFLNFLRQGLEKVDQDDQVELVDGKGKQHGPDRTRQVQVGDQQIVGDQTAGEEHGHNDHLHEELLTAQKGLRKRIRKQHHHEQRDGCTCHGVENGVAIGTEEIGVGENLLISVQIPAHGPEGDLIVDDGLGVGQGQR